MTHLLGMGSERNGRPKQILCYRAGDKTGRIGSGEARNVWPTCYPDRSSP